MKNILAIIWLCAMGVGQASAASLPIPSVWKNQRGSVLTFKQINAGKVTGSFVNNANGFECKGEPGYRVDGNVNGTNINFAVDFKNKGHDCYTITSWIGTINGNSIHTDWELAYIDGGTHQIVKDKGSDDFTLQP